MNKFSNIVAVIPSHAPKYIYTYGNLLIDYLQQISVKYVFGIPGGAIEPLYNALAISEMHNGPRSIVTRHETGAAFMADGYYQESGHLGVCCATTGPGATNLITGIASAFSNNSPVLAITAQTALSSFGKGAFQESSCTGIDTLGMFEHCTKYNTLVSHPEQLERKLATAILTAFQPPYGPVHLSIPIDVLNTPAPVADPSYNLAALMRPSNGYDTVAAEQLSHLLSSKALSNTNAVVFLIGESASNSVAAIVELAERLNAPIVTTPHGKGLINPYHRLYRGVIGFAGHQSARETLANKNIKHLLAIGTNLGEWASNRWDETLILNKRLIHIDELPTHFLQSPMATLHVQGHIASIFNYLLKTLKPTLLDLKIGNGPYKKRNIDTLPFRSQHRNFILDDEAAWVDESSPIKPQRLMHDLPLLFPPNTRYLADTGNSFAWAIHYLHPCDYRNKEEQDTQSCLFRTSLEFASMGWAIGCAVGISIAQRNNPVVCITGDGSWLMSGQEITVAIEEQLTVIFIILNDGALGMVKHGQQLTGSQSIGTKLQKTNFAAMATAMGANSYHVKSAKALKNLPIKSICHHNGPTLIDVHIDPDAIPPIGMRTNSLKEAQ
ncbi:MAG: thiamine pyrophosphate-binding protein [Pseudomonadales bacterium]